MTQLVQTKAPGTPCYMPPEALSSRPKYNTKIDIYSMGVMLIHMFCGEWPFPTDAFQPDPGDPDSLVPVTEVERRAEFLRKIGDDHPLTPLMRRCLSNKPTLRPSATEIHVQLSEVKGHLPAMAVTRIDWFRQLQSSQDETLAVRRSLEEERKQIEILRKQVQMLSCSADSARPVDCRNEVSVLCCVHKYDIVTSLYVANFFFSLYYVDSHVHMQAQLLHPQSKLQWKRCADTPVKMFRAQAVAIGNEVYVGGGVNDDDQTGLFTVFKYNTVKDEWSHLPDHCVGLFGLCEFQGELLSVGGGTDQGPTNKVYRYSTADRKWVESLKPMQMKEHFQHCLTTASAIVVCGGDETYIRKDLTASTVEVYSSTTSQWHTADLLPQPNHVMTSVTISGCAFLLGES